MARQRQQSSLNVVYGNRRVSIPLDTGFLFEGKELYCAKISPPINLNADTRVEYFHFHSFTHVRGFIKSPSLRTSIRLEANTAYTLTIVEPVMVPQPECLNASLLRTSDLVRVCLFSKQNHDTAHIGVVSSDWENAAESIEEYLRDSVAEFDRVRVGVVQQDNQVPIAFQPLESFFSNINSSRRVLVLVVELISGLVVHYLDSRVYACILPLIPRCLAYATYYRLHEVTNPRQKAFLRRFLAASANSGVLVDLVDQLGLRAGNRESIQSGHFVKISLNWSSLCRFQFVSSLFATCRIGFSRIYKELNESTIASQFWTSALNQVILNLNSENLEIITEWQTKYLLPQYNERKVDFAVLLNCIPESTDRLYLSDLYPLLLVECGLETVLDRNQHKDFSRRACLLSACCIRLAYRLIEVGKDPELARVFGLLVGGSKARLLVAQAVVNQVDGIYEIQANISFEPNWSINLIAPTIVPFETTTFNSTAGIVTIVPPSHRLDWNAAEFEEIQADVVAEAGEPVRAATSNQEQEGTKRLVRYGVPINESVFSQLTGLANETRVYKDAPKTGFIPPARDSSLAASPSGPKHVHGTHPSKGPTSPLKFSRAKRKLFLSAVLLIQRAVALHPFFMPHFYSFELKDRTTGEFEAFIEALEPLTDSTGGLHSFFHGNVAEELIFDYCKFTVHGLYLLYLAHSSLAIVHAGICPSMIKFSPAESTWKIDGYEHAFDILDK